MIKDFIKNKLEKLVVSQVDPKEQPIHRFLILQGNKFQNYKSEVK